ncbi:apolipoprotein N-acyltransferase [Kitasatospora sp. RB6PN24]|uniref:apolipoprotein N-acyltransferase n=1 Tax=Kitasatospora humi TaxID=2893891 RepID=UPI001E339DAB|nr:apolipoprotein N-acyltransferase [Kitasatospora humi]MCC9307185.1 apolipoprotein N-acyltransferase [Kitasatospora humi]
MLMVACEAGPATAGARPTRRLRTRWALATAGAGGALLFCAFPPIGAWPLAPVGVALLVVAVAGQRLRTAAGIGLAFSVVFFGLLVRWLSGNIGLLPWVALSLAESLLLAAMTAPLPLLLRLRGRVPLVALWWTATEAVRSRLPLGGFPWGRLAFSQADSPALGWARVAGAPAVTFVVALVGAALAGLVLAPPTARRRLLAAGWCVVALALSPAIPLPAAGGGTSTAVLSLVQGNVPRERSLAEQARIQQVTSNHADATLKLAQDIHAGKVPQPDLVLWPENSTDSEPRTDPELSFLIDESVNAVNRPILVGAILDGPQDQTYNAGLLWDPLTGPGPWYAKRQLVPFGEYIPARSLFGGLGDLQLIPRNFTPGDRTVVFDVGDIHLSDVICYEIGYDGLVRDGVRAGANLLVEQTNDAAFTRDGSSDETDQQLAMARLRAVEHNRSVAVVSTTGVSAVIRPDGTVAAHTGLWQQQTLTERVPLRTGITPADRVGAWPEAGALAVTVLALAWAARRNLPGRGRKGRSAAQSAPEGAV